MRWTVLAPCALVAAVGCARVENITNDSISAFGVTTVVADIEGGAVWYDGRSPDTFELEIESWGRAIAKSRAQTKEDANTWSAEVIEGALVLGANTDYSGAGVDFRIDGPSRMDTDLLVQTGHVDLEDVYGVHTVTASSVSGQGIGGWSIDLLATSGTMDVDIEPDDGAAIRVETQAGNMTLTLPYGLEYDLQVWGDPDWEMTIEELGFDDVVWGEGYFAGVSGAGVLQVNAYIAGGTFHLREAR